MSVFRPTVDKLFDPLGAITWTHIVVPDCNLRLVGLDCGGNLWILLIAPEPFRHELSHCM